MCPEARERHPLLLFPNRTSDGRAREHQNVSYSTDMHILQGHMARR